MTLYDDMAEWVLDMLTEFGSRAEIRRKTILNTAGPWEPVETMTQTYPCTAVVGNYNESLLDGSAIKQGDKKIIVAASGLAIEPAVTDVIVCNSVAYNIVAVSVVSPAGTPIIYVLQARL